MSHTITKLPTPSPSTSNQPCEGCKDLDWRDHLYSNLEHHPECPGVSGGLQIEVFEEGYATTLGQVVGTYPRDCLGVALRWVKPSEYYAPPQQTAQTAHEPTYDKPIGWVCDCLQCVNVRTGVFSNSRGFFLNNIIKPRTTPWPHGPQSDQLFNSSSDGVRCYLNGYAIVPVEEYVELVKFKARVEGGRESTRNKKPDPLFVIAGNHQEYEDYAKHCKTPPINVVNAAGFHSWTIRPDAVRLVGTWYARPDITDILQDASSHMCPGEDHVKFMSDAIDRLNRYRELHK